VAIELPSEVVSFLNFIGVNWPDVNEDQVRAFAGHVRDFATNIEGTHQAATSTIQQMSSSYSGSSYEQLVQTWANMSNTHMQELIEGCGVVATAMDVAADVITAAKVAAIAELVAMAVSFVADQAAAVVTFGIAEAAEAAIIEGAKKLVNDLINQLEQHIIGEVLEKAVTPLEGVVQRAVSGLVFQGAQAALGVSGGGGGVGASFSVVPSELAAHAQTLRGHADEVAGHAQTFAGAIDGINFGG
jgi:uncharacterized protein YukE